MSRRGQYRQAYVGASPHARALVHTLEMKQRYDNARAGAVSALLKDLATQGMISSIGNNQWDVALKEGAWVRLIWYPDWNALEATVSDRELHRVDDTTPFHQHYAAILDRITPRLRAHGVTAVSGPFIGSCVRTAAAFSASGRGHSPVSVGVFGGALGFHTVGDRDALAEQTKTGFDRLVNEFVARMGVDPALITTIDFAAMTRDPTGHSRLVSESRAKMEQSPLYPFYRDVLSPEWDAYNKFYSNLSSWEEFKTDWSTFVNWRDRLETMRQSVNKLLAEQGVVPLQGPTTVDLPSTFTEEAGGLAKRGLEGAGEVAKGTANALKYGLYAAIGLGSLFLLGSLASSVKGGKDPVRSLRGRA